MAVARWFALVAVLLLTATLPAAVGALRDQAEAPEPAFVRHRPFIYYVAARARDPRAPRSPSPFDKLTPPEFQAKLASVLRDLESEIRGGPNGPQQAYSTLQALASMGDYARPSVPAVVAALGAWDEHSFFRVPYFCEGVKALGQIAPTSPEVIEVLSKKLAAELPTGSGVCHRCGCVLEALEQSGPAAREIAGPVLERVMAEPQFYTTYDWQLGRAVKAIGIGGGRSLATALARVAREDVQPGDRTGILRGLAKDASTFAPAELAAFHRGAATALGSTDNEVRAAAAEALGAVGPVALPDLMRGLNDWHYTVRAAAAQAVGRLGSEAESAAGALAAAVDPFLGTGAAAAEALVAIGPAAMPAIARRRQTAPAYLAPLLAASSRAVEARSVGPIRESLARDFQKGPNDQGFMRIDVQRPGGGQTPFDPGRHRISLRFDVKRYEGPGRAPDRMSDTVTAQQSVSSALLALKGRVAGDSLRLLLSPEVAQSPVYGTSRHADAWLTHVAGTPGAFAVTIVRVCEPVVWTLWRGQGIWGPIAFEVYCRD